MFHVKTVKSIKIKDKKLITRDTIQQLNFTQRSTEKGDTNLRKKIMNGKERIFFPRISLKLSHCCVQFTTGAGLKTLIKKVELRELICFWYARITLANAADV